MKRRLVIFVTLLAVCLCELPPARGQMSVVIKADEQFRFAESYFQQGEYYRAISEYERFLHFFPEDPRVELVSYKVGQSYLNGKRFKQAIGAFNVLIEKYRNTKFTVKAYVRLAECHQKLKDPQKALGTLDKLLTVSDKTEIRDEIFYRKGWIYLDMDKWEKAQTFFDKISPANREIYRLKQLSEEMNKKKFLKIKNPSAAGWLAILPGAGHLYCERYRDAFIAFLLNSAMILAAYEAFDHDNEALGGLIAFFELGLYSGNIYSAANCAHKYNRKQKQEFLQYLKEHSVLETSAGKIDQGYAVALSYKFTF